jgi:hypothetical protein
MKTVGEILRTLGARIMGAAIATCVGIGGSAASASEQRLTYTVHMSPYGTIGTYQSAKQQNGDATTITTEAHIKVALAGVVLYRLEVSRVERQMADRLVYLHGVNNRERKVGRSRRQGGWRAFHNRLAERDRHRAWDDSDIRSVVRGCARLGLGFDAGYRCSEAGLYKRG